ncbi:MAG: hypothetical protein RL748_208 [Pseudomonadota bacterium]
MENIPMATNQYHDRKRYTWLFSLLMPCFTASGALLYSLNGDVMSIWWPIIFTYTLLPIIDLLLGKDFSNPPEEAVPALEQDPYYRWLTYALVPMLWLGFLFNAWFFASHSLPWHAYIAGIIANGLLGGYAINLGHEMGHKRSLIERRLARVILALVGYGHFYVEHNRGHHRDVATPEDPASSRMGESFYRFIWREIPGAWRRAWSLEQTRLAQEGLGPWHWRNEFLQPMALTLGYFALMAFWLGPWVLLFLLCSCGFGYLQLSSANYVEHYGLLRQKLLNGRYETCQPQHSWNSNQIFSNWAVLHLQRHSDHHAHPLRRYQSLRQMESAPQLPTGYFGMFLIAYVPPLWYALMNPRLLAAVQHDPDRINFDPAKRAGLMARYRLQGEVL